MRILILSDMHSNLEALNACLEVAPSCDKVANLGDIVGYGGSPNEVTQVARKLGGLLVRGNHDKACTGLMSMEDFNPVAAIAALWTMQALTPGKYSVAQADAAGADFPALPLSAQPGGDLGGHGGGRHTTGPRVAAR